MNILEKIITHKQAEIREQKKRKPLAEVLESPLFKRECVSMKNAILNGSGIISEFKRKSPSAGFLSEQESLPEIMQYFQKVDVSGCSVLTDNYYFGGEIEDLKNAREQIDKPILRKDFIIDEYQIFEAKANGADVILLISEALDEYHAKSLTAIAKALNLEVLMEFHSSDQLGKLNENVDIIGVNNRNLKTLKTDIRTSFELISRLPYNIPKISESGISSAYEMEELIRSGYDGFLIGESVLKSKELLSDLVSAANRYKGNIPKSHA